MAYENVDAYKLRTALNKIDEIESKKIESLKNSLSTDYWYGKSMTRVKEALGSLISEYDSIDKEIEKIKKVPDLIAEYQKLQKNNKTYDEKKAKLRKKYNSTDSDEKSKRDSLQGEINWYTNSINSNNSRMTQLQNQINSLIN